MPVWMASTGYLLHLPGPCCQPANGRKRFMRRNSDAAKTVTTLVATILGWAVCGATDNQSRWVHPLCQPLKAAHGPFVQLADGSRDDRQDGNPRPARTMVSRGRGPGLPESRAGLGPAGPRGVYVIRAQRHWWRFIWTSPCGSAGTRHQRADRLLPGIWAVRGLDGGKTWTDRQRVIRHNPNFFGFIQTKSGRLIAAVPHLVPNPGAMQHARSFLTMTERPQTQQSDRPRTWPSLRRWSPSVANWTMAG